MDGSRVGVMNALIPGNGGTSCIQKEKRKEKKKQNIMKKAIQGEKGERRERKKKAHLFVLQKLRQVARNLAHLLRSLPLVGMTSLRRGRRH